MGRKGTKLVQLKHSYAGFFSSFGDVSSKNPLSFKAAIKRKKNKKFGDLLFVFYQILTEWLLSSSGICSVTEKQTHPFTACKMSEYYILN